MRQPGRPAGSARADGTAARHTTRGSTPYTRPRRGVAQLGSALALGARGHRFKSGHPDQVGISIIDLATAGVSRRAAAETPPRRCADLVQRLAAISVDATDSGQKLTAGCAMLTVSPPRRPEAQG